MRSSLRARMARVLGAGVLTAALLLPSAAPAAAAEPVLRVGTTQDLDSMNPFATALVVGFEVFTLNYELLVGYGANLEPVPGYAESWEPSADGLTWTFKIPEGKLWSDGTPATSEDARWTYQLVLDAAAADTTLGLGYLDPYVTDTGVVSVAAPDPQTFVITLERPNERLLKGYLPILPKHIWESQTIETIGDYQNEPPVVGSGPYLAQEWQTGQFIRFDKNPNYIGQEGAANEVVIQIFANAADTMVQALQNGELDYARGVNAQQFDALAGHPDIVTVAGTANGFTELGFNAYGTTGKTIEGGGPSTPALADAAFRDALGYAIDKPLLVDRVLGGYGDPGTTQVPPFQTAWHKEPATPRTFDIAVAAQKLEDAGYTTNDAGQRLDKEGNPIVLDLVFPDSESTYPQSAEFITEWFGQLGVTVNGQQYDSDTLIDLMLSPEAGEGYTADFDLFIWGWGGDVDPNSLLGIFKCDEIGNSSDSLYCNPAYDALFEQQNLATTSEERKPIMDQMQDLIYDEAPYHILFYDAQLDAYRTDRFSGWQNQPLSNGVPLFGYGPLGYTLLQPAVTATPEPSADAPTSAPTPAASGDGSSPPTDSGDNTLPIVLGLGALVVVIAAVVVVMRRRTAAAEEE
ncbi:MAG: ABC transporter substrate-binding protein [Chloroflexota bacterium]|nr:ABC transporter substrate-binding protein [Chloroflexota bacterium]